MQWSAATWPTLYSDGLVHVRSPVVAVWLLPVCDRSLSRSIGKSVAGASGAPPWMEVPKSAALSSARTTSGQSGSLRDRDVPRPCFIRLSLARAGFIGPDFI
jgi:hypothetical protein